MGFGDDEPIVFLHHWSQACIDADSIIGAAGSYGSGPSHDLRQRISTEDLREAYAGYCKQRGLRPANEVVFGNACTEMFGPRKRLPTRMAIAAGDVPAAVKLAREASAALDTGGARKERRQWGYEVPDGDNWQEKLDARLGIQH